MSIIIYSNDCPRCKVLEKLLDSKRIQYEKFTDIAKMMEIGLLEMPVLEVDNKKMCFHDAINWIKGVK